MLAVSGLRAPFPTDGCLVLTLAYRHPKLKHPETAEGLVEQDGLRGGHVMTAPSLPC